MEKDLKTLTNPEPGPEKASISPARPTRHPEEIVAELSRPRLFFRADRFTYTFLSNQEAASIHFDAPRAEIFLNGHNLRNMKPSDSQRQELKRVADLLKTEGADSHLILEYEACLLKFL